VADAIVTLVSDASNTGKKVDVSELTVGANTVERQRNCIGDPTSATGLMAVKAASTPAALTDCAAVVTLSPNSAVAKFKARDLNDTQVNVKGTPGTLFGVQIINRSGADCFVQVFDAAAGVTLGTEDPVMEFHVPAGQSLYPPLPGRGIAFATGIRVASTTGEKGATGSAAGVQFFAQYV